MKRYLTYCFTALLGLYKNFRNVTSSQKKTLSCGMIKPQSINKKEVANMKIKLNPDQEIVNMKRNMAFR